MKYRRVLFISRDDSAMGPLAASVFRSICSDKQAEIISRGLVVLFESPINPKVSVVLGSHELEAVSPTSTALSEQDFDRDTLVLTMSEEQRASFYSAYPLIDVAVLWDYVEEQEIADPYGGTLMDYEKCYEQLAIVLKKLDLKLAD